MSSGRFYSTAVSEDVGADPGDRSYHTYGDMTNPNSPQGRVRCMTSKQRSIVVLGFQSVGKSSIVAQFVNHVYRSEYNPTIANTFRKRITYGQESLDLTIHDTTGQDKFTVFSPRHHIGAHGYILVYDVTSRHSFEIARYINDKILVTLNDKDTPRLLVGNKCDMGGRRRISYEEGEEMAAELGCIFLEVSAKDNKNVEECFHSLLSSIYRAEGYQNPLGDIGHKDVSTLSRVLQFLTMLTFVLGIYQAFDTLHNPGMKDKIWVSYVTVGIALYVTGVSLCGLYAATKNRRELLLFYSGSLTFIFIVSVVVGILNWEAIFNVNNEGGAIKCLFSLLLYLVCIVLSYFNAVVYAPLAEAQRVGRPMTLNGGNNHEANNMDELFGVESSLVGDPHLYGNNGRGLSDRKHWGGDRERSMFHQSYE